MPGARDVRRPGSLPAARPTVTYHYYASVEARMLLRDTQVDLIMTITLLLMLGAAALLIANLIGAIHVFG